MGQLRDYNPKMIAEWHEVLFPRRESDQVLETNSWGRSYFTWAGFVTRRDEAVEWCKGPMIHGRFSFKNSLSGEFFFKSKRDAMTFKLAFCGN